MKRITSRLAVVAALALAAGGCGSSGNGESAKAPTTIFADAQAATGSAASVHISGRVVTGGQNITLDIVEGGTSGGGSISENGATFDVVVTRASLYLRGDRATWTKAAGAAVAGVLAGRWLSLPRNDRSFAGIAKLVDLHSLVSSLKPSGTLTKRSPTKVGGTSVVPLVDGRKAVIYVASVGRPYLVGIQGIGGQKGDRITFDHYGTAKAPGVPPHAVSINSLVHGAG